MASFAYTRMKRDLGRGTLNLHTGGNDIRVALVKTTSTADTEKSVGLMNGFTTLAECDATNYVRKAIANEIFNEDQPNDRGEFASDTPVTWTTLGGAVNNQLKGAIFYKHVTVDGDSIPLFYVDIQALNGGNPVQTNGSDINLAMNVEGWLQVTQGP